MTRKLAVIGLAIGLAVIGLAVLVNLRVVADELAGTGFTYQGYLTDDGSEANGEYDFEFKLYDAAADGSQVGGTVITDDVTVTDGLFTVNLDFGSGAFTGDARWLEIGVRDGGETGAYTPILPRTALAPAPYALHAADAWTLNGNGGTTHGTHVLGTTDNVSLTLVVSGSTALRLEPATRNSLVLPNVIAGSSENRVSAGTYAATVGGGHSNGVSGRFATASGGESNTASGDYATVPGGSEAQASLTGQMAYASGHFATPGDAQASLYVLRNQTAGGTTELFLDGTEDRLTVASGRTLSFDALIVARDSSGNSAGYRVEGVIENDNGTTSFIGGTPTIKTLGEEISGWDVTVIANDTHDALVIKGAGESDIRWVATVRTTEVAW